MPTHRRASWPLKHKVIIAAAASAALAIPGAALAVGNDSGPSPANIGRIDAFFSHARQHFSVTSNTQLANLVANPNCTLTVPADPLSAQGLATPYQLGSGNTTCSEANEGTAAFVQATILDPATGKLSVYDPPVTDAGQPLLGTPPPVPTLPPHAVVTIWTGFNGNVLKLTGPGASQFVNFAQQSYSNSPLFFAVLRLDVRQGKVAVPPVGMTSNGHACPTSRGFDVVDQDQSDNVPVSYAAYNVSNGSDEGLLGNILAALGCGTSTGVTDPGPQNSTWLVPSLSSPGTMSASGPLQEEQASVAQKAPVALVPGLDDFVTGNGLAGSAGGTPDLFLQDLYRLQVGQPLTFNDNDTKAYCQNLAQVGVPILQQDAAVEANFPTPQFVAGVGSNLATTLAARFSATWSLLNCQALTGNPSPIQVMADGNGTVVLATYNGQPVTPSSTPTQTMTTGGAGATAPPATVTVHACQQADGAVVQLQAGTAQACPAGDTPLSWSAMAG